MDFRFKNKNNAIENINLSVGIEWSKQKTSNQFLNTIFNAVDSNHDGVLQENEYHKLVSLFGIADNIEKKDKILSEKELSELAKKIKNNEIDMASMQTNSMIKINPREFDFSSLQARYPSSKYTLDSKYFNGKLDKVIIVDKKTNKTAIEVTYDRDGFYVTQYDKNGDEAYFYNYSSNGVLNFYDTYLQNKKSVRQYPINDLIYKDITAKTKFGLPTTGKDIAKHVSYLNKNNIITLMDEYQKKYGESLVDAINSEYGLDKSTKNKLLNHIKKCYEELYGYKNNFIIDSSQTRTKWHKGDNYSIENKNDIIIIKNKKNGKTRTINLNELVKNLSLRGQAAVKAQLVKLPGEVLMDLAIEVTSFKSATKLDKILKKTAAAYYHPATDNITLGVGDSYDISDSLVHELGHAVDFTGNLLKRMSSSTSDNYKKFVSAFEKERAAYVAQGGKIYDKSKLEDEVFMGNAYIRKEGGSNISIYATYNIHECFAECYNLLTTGVCNSADLLEDFFPQTIKAADEMLNYIRSLDDSERH